MQGEKPNTILVEHGEETFEFGEPRQLPDGRVTVGVVNLTHDNPEEHAYSVFFDVSDDDTGVHVRAARCSGPGYKYHDGDSCKHCEAAEESGELLGQVVERRLDGSDEDEDQDAHATADASDGEQAVATDGGTPTIEEGDRVRDSDGVLLTVKKIGKESAWLRGTDANGHEVDLWFTDGENAFYDAIEAGEITPVQAVTDGGQPIADDGSDEIQLEPGMKLRTSDGKIWKVVQTGVEKEIFGRTKQCTEIVSNFGGRSWVPSLEDSVRDDDGGYELVERTGDCPCGRPIYEEVTL